MEKKEKTEIKKWLLLITYALVLLWLLEHYTLLTGAVGEVVRVLAPFIAGIVLAYLFNLMMSFYERRLIIPLLTRGRRDNRRLVRPVAIVATLFTVALLVGLLINFIIPQLTASVSLLVESVPDYWKSLLIWLEDLAVRYPFWTNQLAGLSVQWQEIAQRAAEMVGDVAPRVFGWTKTLTTGFVTMVMGFIISIYLLAGKEKYLDLVHKLVYAYLPERAANRVLDIGALTNQSFGRFISGQLTEITILGCLCFVGLNILRMPYPLLISVMIAVTALVPIFGAYIGTFISAFLILMIDPLKALWFVIFVICLQQVEGKIIYPRVVGSSIGLGGFWVLFAIVVGGSLFGLPGMLIGIPIFAVCYTLIREDMYRRLEAKRQKRE